MSRKWLSRHRRDSVTHKDRKTLGEGTVPAGNAAKVPFTSLFAAERRSVKDSFALPLNKCVRRASGPRT